MTDIALHRAQRAVPFLLGILLKGVPEAFHLDRVTQFRARAMGLDQLNARRIDLEFVIDLLLQARLRFRIGRGDPIGPAVLIDVLFINDAVNDVPIFLGVGQPF